MVKGKIKFDAKKITKNDKIMKNKVMCKNSPNNILGSRKQYLTVTGSKSLHAIVAFYNMNHAITLALNLKILHLKQPLCTRHPRNSCKIQL